MTPPTRPTSRRIKRDTAELKRVENQALRMRTAGATYDQIAEALGYRDHSGAWAAVDRALARERHANVTQHREESLARLDRMLRTLEPGMQAGDVAAVRAAVQVERRRAALLGLDAPTQITVTSEIDAEIERLMGEMAHKASPPSGTPTSL